MDTQEQNGAEIRREEFGATESRAMVETASTAVAAQATAAVQARYVVALQRPRDLDVVRAKLLRACQRSSFAEVAIYNKPLGGEGVEGPSIRFAEEALRAMTNVLPEVSTIYDDKTKRIVRVAVTDLEANLTYSKDVVIPKTIERKRIPNGVTPLGVRFNTRGEKLYIIEATDDDILNKENALISKAIRTSGLRLVPGDIVDECMEMVRKTRKAGVEADPDAARKRVVDAFAGLNIMPDALKAYLGHDLATATPAEIEKLKGVYAAIKDGEATWAEVMDSVSAPEGDSPEAKAAQDKAAQVRAKLEEARKKRTNGTTQAPA